MRPLLSLALLALVIVGVMRPRPSYARPEFARREGRACGYCHINPRGGGARNQTGLAYARNEFKFPPKEGDLNSFTRPRDREGILHARKMLDLQHIKVAVTELKRLAKSVKGDTAKAMVLQELHDLDVKGNEILGQARLMLRKSGDERLEAVELLVLLTTEYKGLEVHTEAMSDLREVRKDKELKGLVVEEQREAKARLVYLDALRYKSDGKQAQSDRAMEKLLKNHAGSRAAKDVLEARQKKKKEKKKGQPR